MFFLPKPKPLVAGIDITCREKNFSIIGSVPTASFVVPPRIVCCFALRRQRNHASAVGGDWREELPELTAALSCRWIAIREKSCQSLQLQWAACGSRLDRRAARAYSCSELQVDRDWREELPVYIGHTKSCRHKTDKNTYCRGSLLSRRRDRCRRCRRSSHSLSQPVIPSPASRPAFQGSLSF